VNSQQATWATASVPLDADCNRCSPVKCCFTVFHNRPPLLSNHPGIQGIIDVALMSAGLKHLEKLVLNRRAILWGDSKGVLQDLMTHLTAIEFTAVPQFWDSWQGPLKSLTLETASFLCPCDRVRANLPALHCGKLSTVRIYHLLCPWGIGLPEGPYNMLTIVGSTW
jgi:hypothetical protein